MFKLGQYMAGMEPTGRVILHRSLGAGFVRINSSWSKTKGQTGERIGREN